MLLRLQFALVIVVLLCVPALTRAVQRLEPVAVSPQVVGLSRNCEDPPQRVQALTPQSTSDVAEILDVSASAVRTERVHYSPSPGNEGLRAFLVVPRPDSLRAPPASRS